MKLIIEYFQQILLLDNWSGKKSFCHILSGIFDEF